MTDLKLYAAPIEGLTTYLWRRLQYELFGGADKYFTPFLSPNSNLSFQTKELDELRHNEGMPVVPQLLCNRADHFLWAARALCACTAAVLPVRCRPLCRWRCWQTLRLTWRRSSALAAAMC